MTGLSGRKVGAHRFAANVVILLSVMLVVGCAAARSSPGQGRSNGGTGVPVASEFQAFYGNNGGLRIFGYPLVDPYEEEDSGRLIQYFQHMRLEYEPGLEQVIVTPLGEWSVPDAEDQVPAPAPEDPESLTSTDSITVQDEFLAFYENHGGISLFGRPISNELDEGGTRAQYFENARLEWHPDAPLDYRVQVGMLGEAHYRHVGRFEDPGRSRPNSTAGIREAKVSTIFRSPILYSGDRQTIYVKVETLDGRRPVEGVYIDLAIRYNGRTELVNLPNTDGTGLTKGMLPLPGIEPGQRVQVLVTASTPDGTTIGTTIGSFKTWW